MNTRKLYNGTRRNLLIAMDVGTTYSGASYCLLDPGFVPEIQTVTRFPAREHVGGDAKIPSIIYYGQDGSIKAVGAEATQEGILEKAEDEDWVPAKWFKLHLRPNDKDGDTVDQAIPPLPLNKSAVTVFSDFLRYLFQCTKDFIVQSGPNGASVWESVEDKIQFILSHPNGWEGAQQSQMRRAAILAGLITDSQEDHGRVQFVTEGEASLHYCLNNGCVTPGRGVVIVDAGGGTVDLSSYEPEDSESDTENKISFREMTRPQCHFTGSIFVKDKARQYLQNKLADSRFLEDIDHICECFDKTTKLTFKNTNEPAFIRFGRARDRDLDVGIKSGQMKLSGEVVAKFFEPSIHSIMNAVIEQQKSSANNVDVVFLVGGFAANDYLYRTLTEFFKPTGLNLYRPQNYSNKAVADGAVSFYLDHFVTSRIARWHYGARMYENFDASDPEHVLREQTSYVDSATDRRIIPNLFDTILSKNTRVAETTEFRKRYFRRYKNLPHFKRNPMTASILCYRGEQQIPKWIDDDADNYLVLCRIKTDVQIPAICLSNQITGKIYHEISYSIILSFGLDGNHNSNVSTEVSPWSTAYALGSGSGIWLPLLGLMHCHLPLPSGGVEPRASWGQALG
ncbi:hypothetical protein K435DRAFT_974584 [Dendrothele bispora CBS 962.96]|uniref:Actin-like ATPase domain-containing protein n=1 Tax=Dendrothele bispora (strain CBS 962.96) TaxID=1314807 RepID=A0A4S8KKU6_DENBC|nr:hypothetical protein K435DRAFT_974584 [Dendrothele bispora CBS 962.96]